MYIFDGEIKKIDEALIRLQEQIRASRNLPVYGITSRQEPKRYEIKFQEYADKKLYNHRSSQPQYH